MIINEYLKDVGISLFIYLKESQKTFRSLVSKKIEFVSPQKFLEELQKGSPLSFNLDEEILTFLHTLIKIWVKSPSHFPQLQRDLLIWQEFSNSSLKIISSNLPKTANFWLYLNYILIIFLLLWNGFYFFIFLLSQQKFE